MRKISSSLFILLALSGLLSAQNYDYNIIVPDLSRPYSLEIKDITGDGKDDIGYIQSRDANHIAVLEQGDSLKFTELFSATVDYPIDIAFGQFNENSDMAMDIVTTSRDNDRVELFLNDGQGDFSFSLGASGLDQCRTVRPGDFNGDGFTDLLVSQGALVIGGQLLWYQGDGSGNFTEHQIEFWDDFEAPSAPYMEVTDLDQDGDEDFVFTFLTAGDAEQGVFWYENDSTGSFTKHLITSQHANAYYLHVADINNDEAIDIVVTSPGINSLVWLINDGNEVFTDSIISNQSEAHDLSVADLNTDGLMDIITIDGNNGGGTYTDAIIIYHQLEEGGWSRDTIYSGFDDGHRIETVDLDFDGDMDVVGTNNEGLFYLLNKSIECTFDFSVSINQTGECEGDFAIMNPNILGGHGTLTYTWYHNSDSIDNVQVIESNKAGIYKLKIQDGSCIKWSDEIRPLFYANPVVDLGLDQMITTDEFVTLSTGLEGIHDWSTNENTPSITISGQATGIGEHPVNVTVTDTNGCVGKDTVAIIVTTTTGVSANQSTTTSISYITTGHIQLQGVGNSERYELFNVIGTQLKSGRLEDHLIDIESFESGQYILVLPESQTKIRIIKN